MNSQDIDKLMRELFPVDMRDGVDVKIEFKTGFELFNTYPYHNWETWSQGWYITAGDTKVQGEYLDEALLRLKAALEDDK